jgi:hypothetical protein
VPKNKQQTNKKQNIMTTTTHPISETGYAPTVNNYRILIDYITSYGIRYEPASLQIQLPILNNILDNTNNAMQELNTLTPPLVQAINQRETAFAPVAPIASRALHYAETLDINPNTIKALKELLRRLQGRRAKAKKIDPENDPEITPETDADPEPAHKYISVSQLSFPQRIEHFEEFIDLLKNEPLYDPNEKELTIDALEDILTAMRTANHTVTQKEIPVRAVRTRRDQLLFTPVSGLVDTALSVKKYVYAAFGRTSQEYKNIAKIPFRKK